MLVLAIDTSGKQGSIALARAQESEDDIEVIEVATLVGGTFSAQLVPQIAALLSSHGLGKHDLGALAVASGPGSFTGLRVGLAAVKALAEVLRIPIAAVPLLEVCAVGRGTQGKVMAVLDAGRGEVYTGEYEIPRTEGQLPRESICTRSEFLARAQGWNVVTPDAALAEAARSVGLSAAALPPLSAANVAQLGWRKLRLGQTVAPAELEANYIRRIDAEMVEKVRS